MEKFLNKLGIRGKLEKNLGAILIIALSGSVIYGLPFFRFDYYDAYLSTYHLTNTQMGLFGTVIGATGIISYFFGGIVADRLPLKVSISGSLILTGLGGFVHLLPLRFPELLVLYGFWGISTTFAFWPACVKAVRILADKDDQGKAYGIFEGSQNIASGIVALIAVQFFNYSMANMNNQVRGMKYIIIFYSVMNIAMGIFALLAVKEDFIERHSAKVSLKGMAYLLKHPAIWIICIVTFCNHIFCLSTYYYVPYLTDVFGASVAFGATLAALKKFLGVIGNVGGGYLTDRVGTKNMMLAAYLFMLVGQIIILFLPVSKASMWAIVVLYIILLIAFHSNYAMAWTMMSEGAIPAEYTGTAAGLICMAGAVPQTFTTLLAGHLIDGNPGAKGFHQFFLFLLVMMIVGTVMVIVWRIYLKRAKIDKSGLSEEDLEQLKEYV